MSLTMPVPASRTRSRRPSLGHPRLSRPPQSSAAAPEIRLPPASEVPDYSPDTLALLDELTPLERGVVEWRVANLSVAECYRRASGKESATAKQGGYQILRRPRVAVALDAVLHDRGSDARYDREWKIARLVRIVNECSELGTPAACQTLMKALDAMGRLQGELPLGRSGRRRPPPPSPSPLSSHSGVKQRIEAILADADRATAEAKAQAAEARSAGTPEKVLTVPATLPAASPTPNPRLDQPVAGATRPRPRPAVVYQPVVAPPAIPSPTGDPQLAATPAVAPAADTPSSGSTKHVFTPRLAEDGKPIGEVRPFRGTNLITRQQIVDPPPAGPVLPRVSHGPVRYNGAFAGFMGTWL
jgi:hypothetical protein